MNNLSVLIFDLDGLILNSLPQLQNSMMRAIEPFIGSEEERQAFKRFDSSSPGLSRFEKARFFSSSIAEKSRLDEKSIYEEILVRFSQSALNARLNSELDKDIFAFVNLKNKFQIILISNCDNKQMPIVLAHHNLLGLFEKGAFGTPPSKLEQARSCVQASNVSSARFLSISDSHSDLEIAKTLGMTFAFVSKYAVDNGAWLPDNNWRFNTLGDLFNVLDK